MASAPIPFHRRRISQGQQSSLSSFGASSYETERRHRVKPRKAPKGCPAWGHPTGALDGGLTLHSARWEDYSDARGGGRYQGPLLEIGYWIGTEIGTLGADAAKYQRHKRDQWIVLHFHFQNHASTFKHRKGEDTLFNLRRITGYYGRTIKRHSRTSDSRVDGEHSYRFTVLKCGNEENWFIGATETPATVQGYPYATQLAELVQRLHDQGYLGKQAFLLPYPVQKGRELRNPFFPSNYHAEGEGMGRNFVMVEKELVPGWREWEIVKIGDIAMNATRSDAADAKPVEEKE